jgi:hypothetical protein
VRKYFREIREAKAAYLDIDKDRLNHELLHGTCIMDSLPLVFGCEDKDKVGPTDDHHEMQID